MADYQILYWHDIPLQVRVRQGRERSSKELSPRFQIAVDNASMESGLTGTDAYLELLQWTAPQAREGSVDEVLGQVVAELEGKFPKIDWKKTVESLQQNRE